MTEGYRAPDEVLKLGEQLRDKVDECEELRSRILDLETELAKAKQRDPEDAKDARSQWTWRLLIVCGLGFLAWLFASMKDCTPTEMKCRDAVINVDDRKACPYPGQSMTATDDPKVFKCWCAASPAASVEP